MLLANRLAVPIRGKTRARRPLTAVWTSLDGSLGDIPITALVRDDATGDLYAANDFGVLRLPAGSTVWQSAARGLPKAEIPSLAISTSARVL
jgi:hypothetical protein